jgi:Fur family ferric uptake transcriptional regulator
LKKQNNIRITNQRKILMEELRKLRSHPTADELYEIARKRLPHISLGTVYRNLEFLSRKGIIRKLEIGGAQKRFDGDLDIHQHIRCTECGRIDDLPAGTAVTRCDREILESTEYEIIERRVEFIGICPGCRARRSGDGPEQSGGTDTQLKRKSS